MKNLPWGAIGRALLLVLGVVVVTLLIRNAGPAKVAAILSEAWIFFPLLALCEMGMVACDVSCVRWQLGERALYQALETLPAILARPHGSAPVAAAAASSPRRASRAAIATRARRMSVFTFARLTPSR